MSNSKETFYASLMQKIKEFPDDLHKLTDPQVGFYELCQKYLDVALNSIKIKDESGNLQGVFQYSDMDIAQEATIEFVRKNDIQNLDEFFGIIKRMYPKSKSDDDTRQIAGMDYSHQANMPAGYAGTLYFFNSMPSDIFEKLKTRILKAIQNL